MIRVLVVDDSVFMRSMLKRAVENAADMECAGSAQNGLEALSKVKALNPDVVTLDVEMPGKSGIDVLREIMGEAPLPCVMVSTKTQEGAALTFEALEAGAVDYVPKPLGRESASLQEFQERVLEAVRAASQSNRKRLAATPTATRAFEAITPGELPLEGVVVAIGISAGGPATLHGLIPALPSAFPPVVITQHMPAGFTGPFAARLDQMSALHVVEGDEGERLEPGKVIIAPGDRHMRVRRCGTGYCVTLDDGPKVSGFRPSVDVLFESVAHCFRNRAVAIVMTGMGADGADGIRKLHSKGAATLAQDQSTSIVYGMPKAALETGCIDRVVALDEIPTAFTAALSALAVSA